MGPAWRPALGPRRLVRRQWSGPVGSGCSAGRWRRCWPLLLRPQGEGGGLMLNRLSLAAGAIVGALASLLLSQAYMHLVALPVAREQARALERYEMEAATVKAIGELTNEADRARVNRRLCLERGGVYL